MLTNPKYAMIAGAVATLCMTAFWQGTALAQSAFKPGKAYALKVLDADAGDPARTRVENGVTRLRKTDEEFTNEQAVSNFFADGRQGLYVEMRTGALPNPALPNGGKPVHRMQAACVPLALTQAADGKVGLEPNLNSARWITDNNGNEYRNANKPDLIPIDGGQKMMVVFNYQPNNGNDTHRYAKVLDANCNELPIQNANGQQVKQVRIMQKNNDDCSQDADTASGRFIESSNGRGKYIAWAGCNGNGADDGWLNSINVNCGAGACAISKDFDISLAQREERTRGTCTVAQGASAAICSWTEGNNQPQRDGVWMAAVDISGGQTGANVQSRLLWKEQIDGRKNLTIQTGANANGQNGTRREQTYASRAQHSPVMAVNAAGQLVDSDTLLFRSGDLYGRNNNNDKGGTYRAFRFSTIKATANGMEYIGEKQKKVDDMLIGIDGTHLVMCPTVFGQGNAPAVPGFTLLQGSHNGGGAAEPVVKMIGYDPTTKGFKDMGTARTGGSYDRHIYSNYLGNNPGNQGRNFAGCSMLKNPYFGQNGNTDKYFMVHALTGKSPENNKTASLKPSSYVTLLPVVTGAGAAGSTGNLEGDDSLQAGGCAATPGAGSGSFLLLLGVGILGFIRRRR